QKIQSKIMKKLSLLSFILFTVVPVFTVTAQDSVLVSSPLEISGSVDTYYKYDFAGVGNIPTYFNSDQNSISLGMVGIALKKTTGKASFVGELSFGPRGQAQSLPNAAPSKTANGDLSFSSFHIQNLYASYAFTEKFSLTAG